MLGPETLALLIPIIALMVPVIIACTAILTGHQRKMAELYHSNAAGQTNPEIMALRNEVADLKRLMHEQAIAIDNLANLQGRLNAPTQPPSIEERLGTGS